MAEKASRMLVAFEENAGGGDFATLSLDGGGDIVRVLVGGGMFGCENILSGFAIAIGPIFLFSKNPKLFFSFLCFPNAPKRKGIFF